MAQSQETEVDPNKASNDNSNLDTNELVLDEIQLNNDPKINNIIRRASITYIDGNTDEITTTTDKIDDESKQIEKNKEDEEDTSTKYDNYTMLQLISQDHLSFMVNREITNISDAITNEFIKTSKPSLTQQNILFVIENWFRSLNTTISIISNNVSQIIILYYPFALRIHLPDIRGAILKKAIKYMEHYHLYGATEIEKPLRSANMRENVSEWEASFVEVDDETLFEMILASKYLKMQQLMDLSCAKVASQIKGKSPEEIRKRFNIENDFSPEEEEAVRAENRWAEDS